MVIKEPKSSPLSKLREYLNLSDDTDREISLAETQTLEEVVLADDREKQKRNNEEALSMAVEKGMSPLQKLSDKFLFKEGEEDEEAQEKWDEYRTQMQTTAEGILEKYQGTPVHEGLTNAFEDMFGDDGIVNTMAYEAEDADQDDEPWSPNQKMRMAYTLGRRLERGWSEGNDAAIAGGLWGEYSTQRGEEGTSMKKPPDLNRPYLEDVAEDLNTPMGDTTLQNTIFPNRGGVGGFGKTMQSHQPQPQEESLDSTPTEESKFHHKLKDWNGLVTSLTRSNHEPTEQEMEDGTPPPSRVSPEDRERIGQLRTELAPNDYTGEGGEILKPFSANHTTAHNELMDILDKYYARGEDGTRTFERGNYRPRPEAQEGPGPVDEEVLQQEADADRARTAGESSERHKLTAGGRTKLQMLFRHYSDDKLGEDETQDDGDHTEDRRGVIDHFNNYWNNKVRNPDDTLNDGDIKQWAFDYEQEKGFDDINDGNSSAVKKKRDGTMGGWKGNRQNPLASLLASNPITSPDNQDENEDDENGGEEEENGGEEEENGGDEEENGGQENGGDEENVGGETPRPSYALTAQAIQSMQEHGLYDEDQMPNAMGNKILDNIQTNYQKAEDLYNEERDNGNLQSLAGPTPLGIRAWNRNITGTALNHYFANYSARNPDNKIVPTHNVDRISNEITPREGVEPNTLPENIEDVTELSPHELAGSIAASISGSKYGSNTTQVMHHHFMKLGSEDANEDAAYREQHDSGFLGNLAQELHFNHDFGAEEQQDDGPPPPPTREPLDREVEEHYRAVHEDFETKLENGDYHKRDGTPLHSTLGEAQAAFPIEQQEDQQDDQQDEQQEDQQDDQQEDGPTSTTPPRRSLSRGETPTRREDRPVTPIVPPIPEPEPTGEPTPPTPPSDEGSRQLPLPEGRENTPHNRMRDILVRAKFYSSDQAADDTTDDDVYKDHRQWSDQQRKATAAAEAAEQKKADAAEAEQAKNKGAEEGTPDFNREKGLQRVAEYLHGKDYTKDQLDEITQDYEHSPDAKIIDALDAHRAKRHNDVGQSTEKTENKKKNFDKLMAESQALATSEEDVEGLSPEEATDKAREVVHQIARDAHHYDQDTIRHQQRLIEKLKNSGADLDSIHEELTELNLQGIELGSQAHLDYQEQKNKDALDAAQKEHEDHQARSDALASHLGNAHKHPSHTNANVIHTPEVGEDGKTTGESTAHRIGHDGRGNMYKDEATAGHHPEHGEDWSQMGEEQYHPDAPLYLEHDGKQREAYQKVHKLRHDLHRATGEDATALAKHAQEGREISSKHTFDREVAKKYHSERVDYLLDRNTKAFEEHKRLFRSHAKVLKKMHEDADQKRTDAHAEARAELESNQEEGRNNISNRHAAEKEEMRNRETSLHKQGFEVANHANAHSVAMREHQQTHDAAMKEHQEAHDEAMKARQEAHDIDIKPYESAAEGREGSDQYGGKKLRQRIADKKKKHSDQKADMQTKHDAEQSEMRDSHEAEQSEMQGSHDETHSQMQESHQAAADQLSEDNAYMESSQLNDASSLQGRHKAAQDRLADEHGKMQESAEAVQETDREELKKGTADRMLDSHNKMVAEINDSANNLRSNHGDSDRDEAKELKEHEGRKPEMAAEHMKAAGELSDAEEEAEDLGVTGEQLANPELGAAHEQHAESEENCDGPPDGVVPPIDAQGNAMKWKCGKGRNWVKDDAHQVGIDAAQQGQAAYFPAGEHGNAMISHGGNIFDVSPPEEGQSVDAMSAGLHNAIGGLNLEGGSDDEPHYIPEDILKDAGIDIAGVGGGEEEEPAGEHQKKGDWMGAGSAGQRIEARAYKGAKDWLDRTIGGTKKGGQAQKFLQDLQEGGSKRDEALGSLLRPGRFARGRMGGEGYAATKGRTSDLTPSGKREMARLASRFMPQGAFERAFGKDMRQQLKREDRHEKSKAVNLLVARYKDAADKVK